MKKIPKDKIASVAVVRTDKIGDAVLTLPMLRPLRTLFPTAKLAYVARRYVEPLLEGQEILDEVFYADDFSSGVADVFEKVRFDLAFFPRPRFGEAFAAFKKGVKYRVGSGYRAYSFLFNARIYEHRKESKKLEAEYNVDMINILFGTDFKPELLRPKIDEKALEKILAILRKLGLESGGFFLLHPGSGGSSRVWSPERFGEAARGISEKFGLAPVITGSESEREICARAAKRCLKAVDLSGELSLRELIALISLSRLFLSNSTGPAHLAAALGIPVIGVYPNSPHLSQKRWGALSPKFIALNPPADAEDIDDVNLIDPAAAVEAAQTLLEN